MASVLTRLCSQSGFYTGHVSKVITFSNLNISTFLCNRNIITQRHSVFRQFNKKSILQPFCERLLALNKASHNLSKHAFSEDTEDPVNFMDNLTPEEIKRFKILQLEHDVFFSTGQKVPNHMTTEMWYHVFSKCPTVSSRKKIYKFWFKREKLRESAKQRKEARKLEREQNRPAPLDDSTECENRFFLRYSKSKMNQQLNANNLAFSMIHGPHLLLDLSFQDQMSDQELANLVKQLMDAHGHNHMRSQPFHLNLVNVQPNSKMARMLDRKFCGLQDILISVTEKSYLDLHPKESLVYLSPNGQTTLEGYNPHETYIIGGIVDKSHQDPLTFAKAKQEKIRSARLPLDKHVDWVKGNKSLTVNQVVKILLTLKDTNNDWLKALEHLPQRKFNWR